jgi:hypothetical protein
LTNPAFSNEIEGYASAVSIDAGEAITFYVNSNNNSFTLDVYRLGWYDGLGARLLHSAGTLSGQAQPPCPLDPDTGMVECQWLPSFTLPTQATWPSGLYLAKVVRTDNGFDNHIQFVVRDDTSTADILFQSSVNTMHAYNNWGGKSLYSFQSTDASVPTQSNSAAAVKVSLDRPYQPFDRFLVADETETVLRWEYLMARWLESQGYDVAYCTNLDTHLDGQALLQHGLWLSNGHDEYWTSVMRDNLEAARDAGLNLAFCSANTAYWQVRYEPSSTGVPNRVIVGYKASAADFDPQYSNPALATTRFRDAPVNRPENRLLGVMYGSETTDHAGFPFVVTNSAHPFFRNTGLGNQSSLFGIVGNEWDNLVGATVSNEPTIIPSRVVLSDSPTTPGSNSNAVVHQTPEGALIFAGGTIQWAWGLDNYNTPIDAVNASFQQLTANVLLDLGATAAAPAAGLVLEPSFDISGAITPALADVRLTLTGSAARLTDSASDGSYVFKILENGAFTVTPSKAGYQFTPASVQVNVAAGNVTGIDFTATADP